MVRRAMKQETSHAPANDTIPAKAPSEELSEALGRSPGFVARLLALPAVARSVRAVVVLASGLRADPITLRAGALTYLTVLSLVPLLAVVFALFQAIVGTKALEQQLTTFLIDNLAVGMRESAHRAMEQHFHKATGAAIGGIGFVILLVSAISLLSHIESAFNHIFHAPRQRPWHVRLGLYWCLLTLGPVFLSLSVAGTALLGTTRHLGALRPLAGLVLPLFITYGAFTLLYLVVPAVPVKRRAALVGALVAGTAWEAAKLVYAAWSARSVRANAIYGSLSAIPTFLLWTYVSWVLVLFGARVAYVAQATHASLSADVDAAPVGRELAAARVMVALSSSFHAGDPAPKESQLADRLQLDERRVQRALTALADSGLARELSGGGWVPARDPATIPLAEVRASARGVLPAPDDKALPMPGDLASLAMLWQRADAAAAQVLATTSCAQADQK